MAITKFKEDKNNNKYDDIIDDNNIEDPMMVFLSKLVIKIDEGLTKTNDHINKVSSFTSNISTNSSNITAITNKSNTNESNINTIDKQQKANTSSIDALNTATFNLDKSTKLAVTFDSKGKSLLFAVTVGKDTFRASLGLK